MLDSTTQQNRPFDDLVDAILLKAERYNWDVARLTSALRQAGVPDEYVDNVIKFMKGK